MTGDLPHPDRYHGRALGLLPGDLRQQTSPMLGAGTTLGGMMWELHLPVPDITNTRARYWFTQRGRDRFGRALASEGRLRGYLIKVIRRKNPRRSQIVFADTRQMAVLPDKGQS